MTTTLKQTTIVTAACLAFLAGMLAGRWAFVPLWPVLLAAVTLLITWRTRWRPLMLIGLFLTLGLWRAGLSHQHDLVLQQRMGQLTTFSGTVKDDPSVSDANRLSFTLAADHMNGVPYKAKINVYTYRMPMHRGYRIAMLAKPKPTLGASAAQVSFPQVEVLSTKLNWLERWRLQFFAGMRSAIPEPLASFALGLLIGARSLIPKTLNAQLSAVGLSHLVAVSGYNLTIIVDGVRRWLKGSSKFLMLGLSLWLIGGFVVVAGASASIVRAAVVSTLMLVAAYYGREIKPWLLLSLAAALTAGFNPSSLYHDLGWQLSFAAFAGILLLAPRLNQRLGGERHPIVALAVEAISAYIVTLPIIVHNFGTFTPIAPIANLLVMPLVPLAMLTSFLAALASMIVPLASGWLAWPAIFILRFMVGVIEQAAKVHPGSISMSTPAMMAWYGLLGLFTTLLARQPKRAGTWYNDKEESDVGTLKVA